MHPVIQLEGQDVRCGLREIQKADVGRKFLRKDRRPLDPPPTCLLSLLRVYDPGTPNERQEPFGNYDDVRAEGWVCHVEMFGIDSPQEQLMSSGQAEPSQRSPFSAAPSVLGQSLIRMNNGEPTPETSYATPKAGPVGPERLGQNMTAELRGSTFTQALKIDYDGRKCLVFAFTDLSSTTEGTFVLRYRCFNLFAAASVTGQCPVVAEGIGDPFTVYSTRTFPGLGESTPLTKALSSVGMHPNKRESVRKSGPKRKSPEE